MISEYPSVPRLSPDGASCICDQCKREWLPGQPPDCPECEAAWATRDATIKRLVKFGKDLREGYGAVNALGPQTAHTIVEHWDDIAAIVDQLRDPEYVEYVRLKGKFEE